MVWPRRGGGCVGLGGDACVAQCRGILICWNINETSERSIEHLTFLSVIVYACHRAKQSNVVSYSNAH